MPWKWVNDVEDIRSDIKKVLFDARQAGMELDEVLHMVKNIYYSTDLISYIREMIERDQKV